MVPFKMSSNWNEFYFTEGTNTSAISSTPPGPYNHVKSSLLGSTSDSNINKYSTINKIPLIALNFSEGTEKKPHSPPTSETTIIAPKVKDRTHNVTEKVTQVSREATLCFDLTASLASCKSCRSFDNVKCNLKCILAWIAVLNNPWLCISKIPTGFVCGWEAGRGIVFCHCNRSWWSHGSLTQDMSVYYVGKGHKGKGNWASWNPEEAGRIVKKKGFQFILINISEGWLFRGGRERTFRRSLIKDILFFFSLRAQMEVHNTPAGFQQGSRLLL